MFTGDSLTVISMLLGVASGAALGAIAANPGKPRSWLWRICLTFLVLTTAWIFAPSANQFVIAVKPIVGIIVSSGAFIMVGSVLLVLLTISARRTPSAPPTTQPRRESPPAFARRSNQDTKWHANLSLSDAAAYMAESSEWISKRQETSWRDIESVLEDSLHRGKLTGWAKGHPSDETLWQVQRDAWEETEMNRQQDYVFFTFLRSAGHGVMLCQEELEAAFPPAIA